MSSATQRVLTRVNEARAREGIALLAESPELCWAALDHSMSMASRGFFDFVGPDGVELGVRIARSGYRGTTGANLSHGYDTPEEAVDAWLSDPGTRQSLLNPEYQHLGVGVSAQRWTIILGFPAPEKGR
jgi:uncharacterized protein YkwD